MTRALVAFVLVVMGVAAAADAAYLEQRVQKEAAVALLGEDAFEATQLAKLLAADGATYDYFGWSVSVSGSLIVVGANGDDDKGSNSGSAYVFEKGADGAVTQLAKLTAADGWGGDNFGWSVAVSGSLIVVSAIYDDDKGSNSGSAYVFEKGADGAVTQLAKLTAADGAADDNFGWSVAVSGSLIVVGAIYDDDKGSNSGSAYVFEKGADGAVTQLAKLTAADGWGGDQFGYSVAVSGSLIVVSAIYDDDKGSASGAAYVFEKGADGAVTQLAKLTAADGAASDLFGFSVAVSGSLIVVSAKYDDDKGSNSGSAYVFQTNREDDVEEEADEEATGSGAADITATFDNVVDGLTFTTTVTKSSDGTYNVTAEQSNSTTTTAAFLGAAASAVMKSSVTRVGAPVVALAAVAAVAGVLFNKSRRRRSRVGADEETPLVEGTKYGAVHV